MTSTRHSGSSGATDEPTVEPPAPADPTPASDLPGAPAAEQSVGRASALMAAGTLVSRVLGLVRQAMLVWVVGSLTLSSGAFQTANTLPNIVYMLVSGGLLNAVLIPQVTKAMARADGGKDVVDRLLTACFALILGLTVLATALAAPLMWAYGIRGASAPLAVGFAYLCLPQIFFYGAYAILGQVLNARGSYAAFMWTPVLANIIQIAGLGVFLVMWPGSDVMEPQSWTPAMVWVLAGSTTLGIALQALGLVPALRRTGFRWTPRWGFRGYGFRTASTMAGWAFSALVVAQVGGWATMTAITTVAQRVSEAGGHPVPGLMVYNNAFLVFMLSHSVITTSIITALYPRMSRAANADDTAGLRRLLTQGLTTPSVALVPITAAGLVLAVPGMALVQPGLLRQGSLRETAIVFGIMIVGLIPFGWTTLQQRFLFAVEDGRTNLRLQALLTGVQIAFAGLAFVGPAEHAVAIVAIGQTIGNAAAAVVFVLIARARVGGLPIAEIIRLHVRLLVVSAVAGLVTWCLVEGIQRLLGIGYVSFILQLIAGGLVFVALFLVLARGLHIREVDDLLSPLTTRLRRRASRGASA